MQAVVSRVREHQVVFCGLEVLRLMGERMENQHDVDGGDLYLILSFMRDVVHRCLNNTKKILRFACLDQNVAKHRQALSLFEELSRAKGQAFASTYQRYTDLLANSIFKDRRCLSTLDYDPVTLSKF